MRLDSSVLFTGGFGETVDLNAEKRSLLKNHAQMLDGLSQALVREHGSFILEDNITIATTVSHNDINRAVMDSIGNLKRNINAYLEETQTIDDKSLAKIDALIFAAMNDQLEVVYKERDATHNVPFQTLTILTTGSAEGKPKIKMVDFFNEASTKIHVKEFSEEYKRTIIDLQKLMTQETQPDKGEKRERQEGERAASASSQGDRSKVGESLKKEREGRLAEGRKESVREEKRQEHRMEMEERAGQEAIDEEHKRRDMAG